MHCGGKKYKLSARRKNVRWGNIMLYYTEVDLSYYEIPGERTLNIYISGCQNNCEDCHYIELQRIDYGTPVKAYIENIIELYRRHATCICFMGEGKGEEADHAEMCEYVSIIHRVSMKAALYCGRDTIIESWMQRFDYVKLGKYYPDKGPLTHRTTNQKLYMKNGCDWTDITERFLEY